MRGGACWGNVMRSNSTAVGGQVAVCTHTKQTQMTSLTKNFLMYDCDGSPLGPTIENGRHDAKP